MPLPNFLIIGGQKCGTTWLYHQLSAHPQAFLPKSVKEICFFDVEARFNSLGITGYSDFFSGSSGRLALGEATPTYLWVSQEYPNWGRPNEFRGRLPERVLSVLGPRVKLIVLVRNPIHRAISAFLHSIKMGRIPFGAPIRPHLGTYGIVHMGFFAAHLSRWAEVYNRENLLIVPYEELFSNLVSVTGSIASFLGIDTSVPLLPSHRKYQTSFPYARVGSAFYYKSGQPIAATDDVELLRRVYAADVALLQSQWNIPKSLWQEDFDS